MKKILVVMFVMIFMLLSSASVYADEYPSGFDSNTLYESAEIKDVKILFSRANSGISDIANEKGIKSAKITNLSSGEEKNIETKSTTQLLKRKKSKNGAITNNYATTSFATIKNSDLNVMSLLRNKYDYATEDRSYSVRAYSTIYWDEVVSDGITYYTLDHVSGGWSILDSQATISNRFVRLGQNGWVYGYGWKQQYTPWMSVSSIYTKYAYTSWSPVSSTSTNFVGGSQRCIITQQGSSWWFVFAHNITGTTSYTYD